ncbi:hypothetical protein LCGC14_1944600 [marine sediment metagenome]|uniref:Transglutaminase-like domain-containing protein n=1 Tax=marine sediment metagenome TaxID=412755 RepID=A0A0F9G7Q3_9ZZZZ
MITKKQKKGIFIGSLVVVSAILIPSISVLVYDYLNLNKKVNFYVNNGLNSSSYTVSITRDTLTYFTRITHPTHSYWNDDATASAIASYSTPLDWRILKIAQAIRSKCINQSNSEEVINALLSFTQSIGYKADVNDESKYPLETIFNQGDCEDLSILFGSLVVSLGFSAIIAVLSMYDEKEEMWVGHASVGVYLNFTPTTRPQNDYFDIDSKKYWIGETTAQGWFIGNLPTSNISYYLMEGYAHIAVISYFGS